MLHVTKVPTKPMVEPKTGAGNDSPRPTDRRSWGPRTAPTRSAIPDWVVIPTILSHNSHDEEHATHEEAVAASGSLRFPIGLTPVLQATLGELAIPHVQAAVHGLRRAGVRYRIHRVEGRHDQTPRVEPGMRTTCKPGATQTHLREPKAHPEIDPSGQSDRRRREAAGIDMNVQ